MKLRFFSPYYLINSPAHNILKIKTEAIIMNLLTFIVFGAFFLIPSMCFVFGLVGSIKHAITNNNASSNKCAWISVLGLCICLTIVIVMLGS